MYIGYVIYRLSLADAIKKCTLESYLFFIFKREESDSIFRLEIFFSFLEYREVCTLKELLQTSRLFVS